MAKQHDKQFKLDAVQYYQDHKDLGVRGCAENLGIGYSTLTKWLKDFRESGDIPVRGSGNYASDEQKEIARLRRELRDAQDARYPERETPKNFNIPETENRRPAFWAASVFSDTSR